LREEERLLRLRLFFEEFLDKLLKKLSIVESIANIEDFEKGLTREISFLRWKGSELVPKFKSLGFSESDLEKMRNWEEYKG